jgi:hypothetical protein
MISLVVADSKMWENNVVKKCPYCAEEMLE